MLSALFIAEEQGKWISVPVFWSSLYSSNLHGRKYKSLWTRLILSTTSKHKAVCLLSGSKSKLKTCSYSDIVICCRGGRVIEQLEGGRGEHAKHAPLSIHIFQCLLCTLQIWMFIKLLKQKHALYTYTCTTTWNNVHNEYYKQPSTSEHIHPHLSELHPLYIPLNTLHITPHIPAPYTSHLFIPILHNPQHHNSTHHTAHSHLQNIAQWGLPCSQSSLSLPLPYSTHWIPPILSSSTTHIPRSIQAHPHK